MNDRLQRVLNACRNTSRICFTFTVVVGGLASSSLLAAESEKSSPDPATEGRRVTLTRTVEPSFHIEPIVHRFEARRGAVIPFEFLIKSTGKSMEVSVDAINLRQQESGVVMHDSEGAPPEALTFTTPTEFSLAPGESQTIGGTITVPLAKSNFLSYGVLVRDNGIVSGEEVDKSNPAATSASVRFVTQYVLRLDIETGVKDLSQLDNLVFEEATIRSEKGMPIARAFLNNPTDFAFEFNVRGEIDSPSRSKPTPFMFAMPSRVSLTTEEKYLVRIMPRSRIRLDAPVEELIFPGKQDLRLAITNGRRPVVEREFPMSIAVGDFPALQTQLAYLAENLSVEPAQIEIGQASGNKRTCNLRFVNNSDQPKNVVVNVSDLSGLPIQGLEFSDESFEIKPGRSKTIRATVKSDRNDTSVQFGEVHLNVQGESQNATPHSLPIVLVNGTKPAAAVELGELQSFEQNGVTSFRLSVTNTGVGYAPVHADLQIADSFGRAYELADGYGRWLKPNETRELMFVPETVLEAGDYQLTLRFKTTEDQPPMERTLIITLNPGEKSAE